MKNFIYTIVAISIFIFSACNNSKESETEVTETTKNPNLIAVSDAQFKSAGMELKTMEHQTFAETIKTNGFIDVPPTDRAMVSAIMGGYVKISHLLIGTKVKRGQLLLTIENPDFIEIQQNYLELNETLTYLKNEFERQKTLFNEKITSEKNYLKAESDYKSSLAQFNGLGQKLRLMNININNVKAGKFTSTIPVYAPINGSVTQVYASVGKFMNESDVLVEIIDDLHKHIELVIFEKDVMNVKEGQKIRFKLPENSTNWYDAEVHLIGKAIDEKNRTVKVHGHLENEKQDFLVGMFVEAEIVTNELQRMALPISAIIEEDNSYAILLLTEQKDGNYQFEKRTVEIGLKNENFVEVLDSENSLKDKQILVKGVFTPLEE
ncbi:efflux RND transporter periplasmic adaptor subunit [Lutibacter maritimus]|uniref:Membrane fusion protein, cobalt-zinc-cadmium efflux system n=1 Tax=Lutibacter maritimus TaxID=593133 RepID=A0A1I6NYR8_9FLAO|nr:efflux RND transporter periplasmic adaptor subunit [Lutibacter maritimus]SFS33096.1 membrane fusion protein, cobalt-zinc-cadmium efflux system [Lutibacter maritimus]